MFIGNTLNSIDSKGRIVLPPRFREELGDVFYITKAIGKKCVQILSKDRYETICQKLSEKSYEQQKQVHRQFCLYASEVSPNAQGRITIPPFLRQMTELDGEVLVAGVYDCVEIWNIDRFQENEDKEDELAAATMSEVMV